VKTSMVRVWSAGVMAGVLCVGCGADREAAANSGDQSAPAAASPAVAAQEASVGTVSFTVDARERRFDSLPDGHNNYTPLASTMMARPSDDASEQLMITFSSMDLKKLEYPVELPRPRTAGQPFDPLAAMAMVGFSYRDETGREWAGPGRIRLESFGRNGVVSGTFTNVSLPHTGKNLANITLADGTFTARISTPW
jgi:hypothetical protein